MAYIQQQQQQQTGNGAIGSDASAVMSGAANAGGCGPNEVPIASDGYETKANSVHIVTAGVSDDTTDTESNQAHQTNVVSANLQNANDDSDGGGGGGGPNGSGRASLSGASGTGKSPNSYKYPLLRRYFEFGPWVGRNRKALCLGCRQQTSSSQPDRLLRHLNRCNALTDDDKAQVADLMNERTANKRRKPGCSKSRATNHDDSEGGYYGGDEDHSGVMDDILNAANTSHGPSLNIPTGNLKRLKRDSDKHSHIDEALTRFIVLCRIPLKVIHSREFVEMARVLNPDYQIPSRETITNVLIPGLLNIL